MTLPSAKGSESKARVMLALAVVVLILAAIAFSLYTTRVRPLGELLSFKLEHTGSCTVEPHFNWDNEYQLDMDQTRALLDHVSAIPAKYVGPETDRVQHQADGFSLFMTSREDGLFHLFFYEDGTVTAGTDRFTSCSIGQTEYQTLWRLVDEMKPE